MDNADKIWK